MQRAHRAFLACPVPEVEASDLHDWASASLPREFVRLVPPHQLHLTLLFYPQVDDLALAHLEDLAREIVWPPLPVAVGPLRPFSRTALAVALSMEEAPAVRLRRRLGGSVVCADGDERARAAVQRELQAQRDDPLFRMVLSLGQAESERHRRSLRAPRWHITVARARREVPLERVEPPPPLRFQLDRVVLYESVPGPVGPEYRPLASGRLV